MALDLAVSKLPTYIMSLVILVVLLGGFFYAFTPLGKSFYNAFNQIFGIGEPVPFTGDREEITTATASVHALLWSINKVAWYDTYKDSKGDVSLFERVASQRKEFRGTTAGPILDFGEQIQISNGNELEQLTIGVVDCWKILRSRDKNSACFMYDFSAAGAEITPKSFQDFGYKYNKDPNCNDECQDISKNVFGVGIHIKNYDVHVTGGKIAKQNPIIVCASKAGFLGADKIVITDSENYAYDKCEPAREESQYSIKITNFNLPQTINQPTGTGAGGNIVEFAEKWVNTYGDPEYVLYYEVFPRGEESYWAPGAYVVDVATILTTEAGFYILFDRIIPGLGKVIKASPVGPLLRTLGKGMSESIQKGVSPTTIKGIFTSADGAFPGLKNAFKDLATKIGESIVRRTTGKITVEAAGEATETLIKPLLRDLPDEILPKLKKTFKDLYEAYDGNLFEKTSKNLDEDVLMRLRSSLDGLSEEAKDELMEKITNSVTKDAFEIAAGKSIMAGRISSRANSGLLDNLNDFRLSNANKNRIADQLKKMADSANYFNNLNPKDVRRFSDNFDAIMKLASEGQDGRVSREWARKILGDSVDGMSDDALREALDKEVSARLLGENPLQYTTGKLNAKLRSMASNPRHQITALLVMSNMFEDSLSEKFRSVGTSAIGLRTPFMSTTVYDGAYTETFDYKKDKSKYENFFNYFYGYEDGKEQTNEKYLGYRGLLPEVENYFVSLLTDSGETKRLHLASPCKADIIVTKTTCECWGSEKEDTRNNLGIPIISNLIESDAIYQTGKTYNADGNPLRVEHFDGQSPTLYTVEEGEVVKQCYPKNIVETVSFWKDAKYTPSCVEVSVVLDNEQENNYCYHTESASMKLGNIGLNYVIPITAAFYLSPIGGAAVGAITTLIYANIQADHQWPSHD